MKKNSIRRILLGVLAGVLVLLGACWVLILTLGNKPRYLFQGKPLEYWRAQLDSHDPTVSNRAFAVVSSRVIPQLTDAMFHDTNDSSFRRSLIDTLNQLPGVQIYYLDAAARRMDAAEAIGELGPGAKSAIPALLQALKGPDPFVQGPAIEALGEIHAEPDTMIPLMMGYLDNDKLNAEAAKALASYGALAKAAVPKILPLLHAPDKDARAAATQALQKIAPEVYTNAMKTAQSPGTNGPTVMQ